MKKIKTQSFWWKTNKKNCQESICNYKVHSLLWTCPTDPWCKDMDKIYKRHYQKGFCWKKFSGIRKISINNLIELIWTNNHLLGTLNISHLTWCSYRVTYAFQSECLLQTKWLWVQVLLQSLNQSFGSDNSVEYTLEIFLVQ